MPNSLTGNGINLAIYVANTLKLEQRWSCIKLKFMVEVFSYIVKIVEKVSSTRIIKKGLKLTERNVYLRLEKN